MNVVQSEFKSNTSELNYKQFQNKQKRLIFLPESEKIREIKAII